MIKLNSLRFIFLFAPFIIFISSCSNEFNGKDGIKTVYFPNSKLIKQVVGYKNGKRNGSLKEYYRNGNLKINQVYQDDFLTDSCITYYENGNIQLVQFIKDKKKEGAWKKFNEQGKLYEEVNYKDDVREGYATKYSYRSLKLLEKKHYVEGKENGKQEFFYLNGKPKAVYYSYDNNPCLGTQEWDESGKEINNDFTIDTYEENKLLLTGRFLIHIKLSNPKPEDPTLAFDLIRLPNSENVKPNTRSEMERNLRSSINAVTACDTLPKSVA